MKYPVITPEERRQRLEPPRKKIHVVIDSDTYNEVDDQFAISYAMLSPEKIQMEAIYAAPFSSDFFARLMQTDGVAIPMTGNLKEGLELSYQEILKLLGLLGREDFKDRVFRGSERYMTVKDQPVDSDAARDLVKRVHECEDVLYVIAIGEITNVASAILMDPEIIKKMVVVWLSGQPLYWPHAIEFNLGQDVLASQVILDSGVPLVLVPCMSVASYLSVTGPELDIILKIKVKWEHTFARLLQARCHRKWHRTGWIFSIRHIVQGWMIMAMRVHRRQIPCFRLQGLSGIYLQ